MSRQVLVLNSTYEPMNVCSLHRAVILLLKGKAEIVETATGLVRSERSSLAMPAVIRLLNYVRIPRADGKRVSRRWARKDSGGWLGRGRCCCAGLLCFLFSHR